MGRDINKYVFKNCVLDPIRLENWFEVHINCIIDGEDMKYGETNIPFKFPYQMLLIKFRFHTW